LLAHRRIGSFVIPLTSFFALWCGLLLPHGLHAQLLQGPIRIYQGSGTANDVTLADFNGDGKLDMAAVFVLDAAGTGSVRIYLGDGHAGFVLAPGSPFAVGNNPWQVAAGDFNRDGKMDLAVCNDGAANQKPDSISVMLGDGR